AGLTKVPVQLRHFSEQKKLEIALIENIQRADLNAIEEAQAYYKLMELGGLNQEQVADRVGKKRSTVANAVRLLKLPEDMQNAIVQGKISAGHARALLAVSDATDQRVLFGRIMGDGLSVRQAEAAVAEFAENAKAKKNAKPASSTPAAPEARDPDFAALEGQFRDALGTKVVLKGDMERGTLVIDYYSRADLDRLYQLMIREA
ncbi:MAG: ParB/RepB/Spo0J family partition protein, partial [Treponema sp.]|nr:ParB/RepB/Spo0J family partition protein [Treponema sp.]